MKKRSLMWLGLAGRSAVAALTLAGCPQSQAPKPEKTDEKTDAKIEDARKEEKGGGKTGDKKAEAKPKKPTPKEDKKLSGAEEKQYRAHLDEGRALHKKKDYAGAIKAFEAALAVFPDDPRALSELGWAAFFAKDLDRAEKSTRDALARAGDPNLKGSTLYNLGRIQEERGKISDAVASYRESLKVRPNDIVKKRLEGLDASAASAAELLTPQAMQGPYADLSAFCDAAKKASEADYGKFICKPDSEDLGSYEGPKSLADKPPFLAVKLLAAGVSMFEEEEYIGAGEFSYYLAIKTDKGWFVSQELAALYNPGAFGVSSDMEGRALEVRDAIPGGAPELLFSFSESHRDANMAGAEIYFDTTEAQVICAVGASGKPSCTNPIPLKNNGGVDYELWKENEAELGPPPAKSSSGEWSISLAFLPDGQIELTKGAVKGDVKDLPVEIKGLIGKRALKFP